MNAGVVRTACCPKERQMTAAAHRSDDGQDEGGRRETWAA